MAGGADRHRLLAIYLEDHLAAATVGVELARRLRSSNREDPELGEPLARLCGEIEDDRSTLVALMDHLGTKGSRLKNVGAIAGERLGRLKLNGQITGYSPLSRLLELEILGSGIGGKLRLWRSLRASLGEQPGGIDLEHLAARAEDQLDRAEELRGLAVERALPEPAPGPT